MYLCVLTYPDWIQMQSQEGAALIDVQTTALFGNLRDLQVQMQNAVGQDATSVEELMQKVQVRYNVQWLLRCSIIDIVDVHVDVVVVHTLAGCTEIVLHMHCLPGLSLSYGGVHTNMAEPHVYKHVQ